MRTEFGIVLKEKQIMSGLTRSEVLDLFDMLTNTEAFPIELEAMEHECSAMGFIDPEYADILDYDYERSGLHKFIANILDDIDNENDDGVYEYEYNGYKVPIYLSR